jgi:ankyrin repeat protein
MTTIPRLTPLWNQLQQSVQELDDSFKWPARASETRKLAILNRQRNGLLTIFFNAVRDQAKYAIAPLILQSAAAIKFVTDNYAEAKTKDYEGKTALIINMLNDLETPEAAAHIDRIGQTANLASLKSKNEEFQQLYILRNQAIYQHKVRGVTSSIRKKVIASFENFNAALEGLLLTEADPSAIAQLESTIKAINAEIVDFTSLLHRRLGQIKAEKDRKQAASEAASKTASEGKAKADSATQTPATR